MIATIALVFAMSGGAFAAKYLITSTKQISPSVLKKLKGAAGPAGAPGAQGAPGPAGLAGPAGAAGKEGGKGATGEAGAKGATGATGATGKEGEPWTKLGTLPKGKTETGGFAVNGTWADEREAGGLLTAISFNIPLAAGLDGAHVHYTTASTSECPGGPANPTATSGNLCIYQASNAGGLIPIPPTIATLDGAIGASTSGAVLRFKAPDKEEEEELEITGNVFGSWAVTAP